MRVVQVPTTLLAMVDSSIGGKTGFNLPEGKNLVGTFHQPAAVLADLDTLKTLADREFRGGLAEVVKYALIADPALGDLVVDSREDVLAREDAVQPIVVRSAEIKADVVAADERESGRRAILNYGHTVGHALEALGVAGRVSSPRGAGLHHGEAISVGMVFAAWLAVNLDMATKDLVDEHVRLLTAVGLPTNVPKVSWEDVRRYVVLDKKYAKGVRFVVLREPGKPEIVEDVPSRAIEDAFARVTEAP
jgi:3-dehydroquinate synthase